MEYMMILKQRTAKVLPSQREWLSKCLVRATTHRDEKGEKEKNKKNKNVFVLLGGGVGWTLQHQE